MIDSDGFGTSLGKKGERFKDWHKDVKNNSDLMNLTQPQIIEGIHNQYLEAGADIVETNTFSSTSIAQADYDMQSLAYELNVESARRARNAITKFMASPEGKDRKGAWVAGATVGAGVACALHAPTRPITATASESFPSSW